MKTMKAPTRKAFEDLLFAVHNIAPEPVVEPGSVRGRNVNKAALKATAALYDLMEASGATCEGVLLAVRLLAETTCAPDPEAYVRQETARGLDGEREGTDRLTLEGMPNDARAAGLEDAAAVAEFVRGTLTSGGARNAARDIAEGIRALKGRAKP